LTPERITAVLADFRSWLEQAASAPPTPAPAPEAAAEVDLHTLLSQFVALRHEVNLQTKATRAQQEQNAEAMRELSEALELLERRDAAAEQAEEQGQDERLRPLLKTLVDLHDALSLARREVQRVQEVLSPVLARFESAPSFEEEPEPHAADLPAAPRRPGFFGRLFGAAPPPEERDRVIAQLRERLARQCEQLKASRAAQAEAREAAGQARRFIDSVVTGYTMSLQRLDRALQQQGLEPIATLGQPFDPEAMEVVEVVPGPGRASTEVIEEVRRGYLRGGRVFRFAQVRVAKP
jgi:molecular chaperone GrpE